MKLYYSPTSPYVRKVSIVAIEAGLDARIERLPTNTLAPGEGLPATNPLAKVPTLVTDDGLVLYDSPVICEYLDGLHAGPHLFPAAGPARWQALRRQALADGILDAGSLCRLESLRPPALRSAAATARQWAKVERGLTSLEAEAAAFPGEAPTIGLIAIGCALGWLDFRFAGEDWRRERPRLAAWSAAFAERPAFRATVPHEP